MIGYQQLRPKWQRSLSQEMLYQLDRAASGYDWAGNKLTPEQVESTVQGFRAYSAEPHNESREP